MKYILTFLFGLTVYSASGQDDTLGSFRAINKEVVWQKVFQTGLTANELFRQLKSTGIFAQVDADSTQMTGELRQFFADYKGAGYSWGNIPVYVSSMHIDAFSTIEYKDGRYRVTVNRVLFADAGSNKLASDDYKNKLGDFALKGTRFTTAFKKAPSKILDHTFTKMFTVSDTVKSNW